MTTTTPLDQHISNLCQQKAELLEKNSILKKEVEDLSWQNKVMIASNEKRIRLIDKEIEELKPTVERTVIPNPQPPIQYRGPAK